MAHYFFYFLAALTLFSALMVIVSKNPIHSILYTVLTFFTLFGHYILLNAQFIAVVNVIVYAGAIMVLFVFTVMFLNLRTDTEPPKSGLLIVAAVIAGVMLMTVFAGAIYQTRTLYQSTLIPDPNIGLVENLGKVLFKNFLLPFELASVLFLAAIVGAVMIGKKEKRFINQATVVSSGELLETKQLDAPKEEIKLVEN